MVFGGEAGGVECPKGVTWKPDKSDASYVGDKGNT
jgi:hypothetical protein